MAILQNDMFHSGEGDLILFNKIPVSAIKLPKRRFRAFLDKSLSEKLNEKSHRPILKHS